MKSDRAFRTISEVSEELGVPQHVLRFWETRFAQVRPLKRNGGRRLYRPDHLGLLRGIRALLYDDGMTIKGVQKILREKGMKAVVARGESPEALPLAPPPDAGDRLEALRERLESHRAEGDTATGQAPEAENAPTPVGDGLDRVRGSIARLERILERLEAAG